MTQKERSLKLKLQRMKYLLNQSLKLQSHYAELLNINDGGTRLQFPTIESWKLRVMLTKERMEGCGETQNLE